MKYNVTQLEGKNELVNSVLENYFIELEPGNYQDEEANSICNTSVMTSFALNVYDVYIVINHGVELKEKRPPSI